MSPIEPVGASDLLLAVIAGALVVLCGACYAAMFAFAKLYRRNHFMVLAHVFFGALVCCVLLLAYALHLAGVWEVLVGLLLVGYLIAPRLIWKLSTATHDAPAGAASPGRTTAKRRGAQ